MPTHGLSLRRDAPARRTASAPGSRVCGRCEVNIISAPASIASSAWRPEQVGHAPRDGGRRIDPVDRPRRKPVSAGRATADSACRPARRCRCEPRHFRQSRGQVRRRYPASLTSLPLRADSASEASSADPTSVTSQPCAKSWIRRLVYSRLTVPLVPEHRHAFGLRTGAGRLDRRHGADERHAVGVAQMRHDQRGSGVAGNHHQIGAHGARSTRRPAAPRGR